LPLGRGVGGRRARGSPDLLEGPKVLVAWFYQLEFD
jgi:hypothetical protein